MYGVVSLHQKFTLLRHFAQSLGNEAWRFEKYEKFTDHNCWLTKTQETMLYIRYISCLCGRLTPLGCAVTCVQIVTTRMNTDVSCEHVWFLEKLATQLHKSLQLLVTSCVTTSKLLAAAETGRKKASWALRVRHCSPISILSRLLNIKTLLFGS